jgi:hypothetical protein
MTFLRGNINGAETDRLARRLARLTGGSITKAVRATPFEGSQDARMQATRKPQDPTLRLNPEPRVSQHDVK